jgi:hypothetical protein
MNNVEVNDKIYCYNICPLGGKVYAEIYYTFKTPGIFLNNLRIQVLSKEFGSYWRTPIEKDYIKAKKWCLNQLNYILDANKQKKEMMDCSLTNYLLKESNGNHTEFRVVIYPNGKGYAHVIDRDCESLDFNLK